MNNIFVVGTGRCGTTTFAKACQHATNYTVAHESVTGETNHLQYPESDHIEVDAALSFSMPKLPVLYPDALFIHLVRRKLPCVTSLAKNETYSMRAFGRMMFHWEYCAELNGAAAFWDFTTSAIRAFTPPGRSLEVQLENMRHNGDWLRCWEFMGCVGDYEASLKEWETRYNAST